MNKEPVSYLSGDALTISTSSNVSGTDYGKFERISRSLDQEEEKERFAASQKAASEWCNLEHVHGPECKRQAPSCSHDHTDERNIYEKPYIEKLNAIRMFREEGNGLFKSMKFTDAIGAYKRAVIYLDYTFGEGDNQEDELDQERLKCHLNLAASFIELENYSSAVNECRLAIQIDPENCKAYYRRGVAHLHRGELEEAQADLYKAIKLAAAEPPESRRSVEAAIKDLNMKWRDYIRKSKEIAEAAIK